MTKFRLESVPEGWAVFDETGKRYGCVATREAGKKLLNIRRHMALAGSALATG